MLSDIEAIARIAHAHDAWLMIDNTFTTPFSIKPLTLGADVVISSMTTFLNGHSDALGGSITVNSDELFAKLHEIRMLTGTSGAPMMSYLIFRSLKTADLRIKKQMKNAALLAKALDENPHVLRVDHPSVPSFPDYNLAKKMFRSGEEITGMMSFEMPDDPEKKRKKMGISYGLMLVSVGIEEADDLIADFTNALKVFDK